MQKESRKILELRLLSPRKSRKVTTKSEHHAPEHGVRGCMKRSVLKPVETPNHKAL